MEIWIATGNQGKLKEFERLLSFATVKSINDIPGITMPPETGKTFSDNARIKAKALRAIKNESWVIADDSGIECEGLNHLPGVHSARYAGPNARDVENTAKLLKMIDMRSATNRRAQFKCVIVAYDPAGKEYVFEGVLKGTISKDIRGTNGFGYDNVFIPDGHTKTTAEMDMAEKNKISHRGAAIQQFIRVINP